METGYLEHMVRRLPQPADTAKKGGIAALGITVMAAGFVWAGMLSVLIAGAVLVGAFLLFKRFEIEYEYIYTEGQLDIDQITARERRKSLLTVDVADFEVFAPMTPEFFAPFAQQAFCRRVESSSSPQSPERFFAIFQAEAGRTLLTFEPNEDMVQAIKRRIPRRVKGV